jgi:hypothetical protein
MEVIDMKERYDIVARLMGMTDEKIQELKEGFIEMLRYNEEKKAQMVSNLLVVLCGNQSAQPVINSGSLY